MKYTFLFLAFLAVAACGKKDNIVMPAEPATATKPALPERPVANKPKLEKFFLDGLL